MTTRTVPAVRCPVQSCGGWVERDRWDEGLECGLCSRRIRIEHGRVVLVPPLVYDGPIREVYCGPHADPTTIARQLAGEKA